MVETILINLIETMIFCYFLIHAVKVTKPKVLPVILYIACSTTCITIVNQFDVDQTLYFVLDAVINFCFLTYICNNDVLTRIIISLIPDLILNIVSVVSVLLCCAVLLGHVDFVQLKENWDIETSLFSQVLYMICFYVAAKLVPEEDLNLSKREKWMLIVALIDCQFMMLAISSLVLGDLLNYTNIILAVICMLIFVVLVFAIFYDTSKQNNKAQKAEYEKELIDSQLDSSHRLLKSQEELLQIRHDIKHLFAAINDPHNISPDTKTEMQKMQNQVKDTILPLEISYPIINAVINTKRQEALEKHIDMVCTINVTQKPKMEDEDLCLILSNILDNAIQHIGLHKQIRININGDSKQFFIRCINSSDMKVLDQNHQMRNQNPNPQHGFGIRTIQTLVEKYHGDISMDQSDEDFVIGVMLPQVEDIF